MNDTMNLVMEVITESKHRSSLGFPEELEGWVACGVNGQVVGWRGKTCKLKEQQREMLKEKKRMEKKAGVR